jgi:hypothetical protein
LVRNFVHLFLVLLMMLFLLLLLFLLLSCRLSRVAAR